MLQLLGLWLLGYRDYYLNKHIYLQDLFHEASTERAPLQSFQRAFSNNCVPVPLALASAHPASACLVLICPHMYFYSACRSHCFTVSKGNSVRDILTGREKDTK